MIVRRFFTLAAIAVAASLSLSDRAHANYDTSVSVVSVTGTGVTIINANGTGSFTSPLLNGGSPISTPNGFFEFRDGGGATVYLVNEVLTNLTGTNGLNETIFVSNSGVNDQSSWTTNLLISVTNPSVTQGGGSTGQFGGTPTANVAETANFTMNNQAYGPTVPLGSNVTFGSPTFIVVGGLGFTLFQPGGSGGQANQTLNNGSISAEITTVPEPASVVMLGVGLVGVVGLGLRRMKRQV